MRAPDQLCAPSRQQRINAVVTDKSNEVTSTTLAECVFAAVFQGFAFGNVGTAGAAAEG